jgi:hypothetical protein
LLQLPPPTMACDEAIFEARLTIVAGLFPRMVRSLGRGRSLSHGRSPEDRTRQGRRA